MKFWWRWLAIWIALGICLRGVSLWLYPSGAELPQFSGFAAGVVNDLQAFVLLAGAVALAGFWRQRWLRVVVFVAVLVMVVVFIAELFFWVEFESRLDRLVFHYLAYPKEVLVFLEDQFYLSLVLLPVLLLCALVTVALGVPQMDRNGRAVQVSVIVAGTVVAAFGQPVGGSYSRVASEFASNGYLGVLSAARYREDDIPWLTQHATPHQVVPVALRGSALATQMRRETARVRHVVLIIEESFAGPTWDDAELRREYLPNFTALAQESVAFARVFATGSRTTRGMEALLNGFPPLPGISTTQRGDLHRLPSLARALGDGGFHPVFLYGGWPDFSNFSNYWRATGFREIWTREDFDERFETSWGVADEALLQRLVLEMDQLTQRHDRVFLSTLTVSHHRPYDFPQGRVVYSPSDRRSEHAMAYADHALGKFFQQVRSKPWYDETLFIVAADHGPHPRGDAMIPATSYRIPMVLHAKDLQARRLDRLGSSMNLPITLLSLLNIRSDEAFSGQDMLCDCDTVVPLEYGYRIGLLERDRLHVVLEDGTPVSWRYDVLDNVLAPGGAELRANARAQRRVLGAFAPAYQWYYSHVPPHGELADVNHAEIAGQ